MYRGGDRGGEQTEARLKFRADYLNVGNLQRSQLEEHISRNIQVRDWIFFPHSKCKKYPEEDAIKVILYFFSACFYYVFVYMSFFFLSI